MFNKLYFFLSLKMTFLEALFWDSSTNDTFSCSKSKKNYKIPQRARPDNTRHIAIKPFSRLLLNYYIKHMIKRPFSCNTMLSVLASFLAHCLSIYGQFSVVVFEVGTFFIHEYTIIQCVHYRNMYLRTTPNIVWLKHIQGPR